MWAKIDLRIKVSPQFDYDIDYVANIFFMSEVFQ